MAVTAASVTCTQKRRFSAVRDGDAAATAASSTGSLIAVANGSASERTIGRRAPPPLLPPPLPLLLVAKARCRAYASARGADAPAPGATSMSCHSTAAAGDVSSDRQAVQVRSRAPRDGASSNEHRCTCMDGGRVVKLSAPGGSAAGAKLRRRPHRATGVGGTSSHPLLSTPHACGAAAGRVAATALTTAASASAAASKACRSGRVAYRGGGRLSVT